MVWLWILAVIVLLTVLLCRTRVGAWAAFGGGDLRLDVQFGFLRVQILPAKPKKAKKPPKKKKQTPPKKEPEAGKPKLSLFMICKWESDCFYFLLLPLSMVHAVVVFAVSDRQIFSRIVQSLISTNIPAISDKVL